MASMISPIYDTDQEDIKSQLEYAKALRAKGLQTDGQMVSGFYVPKNPWQNLLEAATGAGVEQYQRGKQGALEQGLEKQRQDFISQMPTGMETVQQEGPMPGGEAMPDVERQVSPRALAQATRAWAAKAPRGMEGVQGYALQQALQAPEKQAQLEEAARVRQHELALKAEEAKALQAERLAAQANQNAMYKRTAEQQQKYFEAVLAAKGGDKSDKRIITTLDENGNPVQQVVDLAQTKPGDTFGKYVPPKKPDAATTKNLTATKSLLDNVNTALGMVDESSGAYSVLPNAVRQFSTSPQTKVADAVIGQLSAEKAHEMYGAAFTKPEMNRAGKFLITDTDTNDTRKWKLTQMKILLEKKEALLTGQPDPYPSIHNDIIEPLSRGEVPQAKPSASPVATGKGAAGTQGGTKAPAADMANFEAYYNSLPAGARYITPDGKPKIKGQR